MKVGEIEDELTGFGLSRNEAKVYLTLLQQGALSASDISKDSGIYRPSVYDSLDNLMERGLASSVIIDGKTRFKASSPNSLEDFFSLRLDKLKRLVGEMTKISRKENETAQVEIFKGKNAVKKAFKDILVYLIRTGDVHLGMGIDERFFIKEDPFFSRWFIRGLEKHGLKEKMITCEGANVFAGGKTTEYRTIPAEYFDPTNILINGSMVTLIVWSEPRYVIRITSEQVANSYRRQFELMWKNGKKVRKWKPTLHEPV